MKVAIIGPNLHDQSKGEFHVHTAECKDGKNGRKYPLEHRTELEIDSQRDASAFIYSDAAGDNHEAGSAGFNKFIDDCLGEFYFHNCTKALP